MADLLVSPGPGPGPQLVPIVKYLVVAAPIRSDQSQYWHNTGQTVICWHLRDRLERKVTWGSAGEAGTAMAQADTRIPDLTSNITQISEHAYIAAEKC